MSFLWVAVWFIVRFIDGYPPQLHILNSWLLTLIIAAILDVYRYRPIIGKLR